jgi:hypothetical protein
MHMTNDKRSKAERLAAHLAFQTAVLMLKDCRVTQDQMSRYLVEVMTRGEALSMEEVSRRDQGKETASWLRDPELAARQHGFPPSLFGKTNAEKAAELYYYMVFRARHEGHEHELTEDYYKEHLDAGVETFFGVQVGPEGLIQDAQQPQLFAAWNKARNGMNRAIRNGKSRTATAMTKDLNPNAPNPSALPREGK